MPQHERGPVDLRESGRLLGVGAHDAVTWQSLWLPWAPLLAALACLALAIWSHAGGQPLAMVAWVIATVFCAGVLFARSRVQRMTGAWQDVLEEARRHDSP
jgi:hypothetical protein